jgi:hypothetical protein
MGGRSGQGVRQGRSSATLARVEADIKSQSFETAILVDDNGNIIFRKDGNENSVSFTREEAMLMQNRVLTHNHPLGRSFSLQDALMATTWQLSEIRAVSRPVSPGGNIRVYRLFVSPDVSRSQVNKLYERFDSQVKAEFTSAILRKQMTTKEADALHHHTVWKRISDLKIGITYIVEDK